MDLENFSRSDIKRHLAELGYSNITEEKLDSFVRDLRKLIKYEERKKEVENKLDDIDKQPPARRSKVRHLSLKTPKLFLIFFPRCQTHPPLRNWRKSRVEECEGERGREMRMRA